MRPALWGRVKRAHHKRHRDTEQFRIWVMFEIWHFSERQRFGSLIVRLLNFSITRWCPRFASVLCTLTGDFTHWLAKVVS